MLYHISAFYFYATLTYNFYDESLNSCKNVWLVFFGFITKLSVRITQTFCTLYIVFTIMFLTTAHTHSHFNQFSPSIIPSTSLLCNITISIYSFRNFKVLCMPKYTKFIFVFIFPPVFLCCSITHPSSYLAYLCSMPFLSDSSLSTNILYDDCTFITPKLLEPKRHSF